MLLSAAYAAPVMQAAPAFSLMGLDGQQHELREWKGKVVLVNFWASWCSSCQSEIRQLISWQAQYGSQGLQVVGIGMDDETRLRNVSRSLGINYPVLFTGSPIHPVMVQYGNQSGVVPYSAVITRTGEIAYTHIGVLSEETFEEEVAPLLK